MLAAGSGVKSVKKGDWVIAKHTGLGTWRTYVQIEEEKMLRVEREGLRSEQVGTVGVSGHWRGLLGMLHETLDGDPISLELETLAIRIR